MTIITDANPALKPLHDSSLDWYVGAKSEIMVGGEDLGIINSAHYYTNEQLNLLAEIYHHEYEDKWGAAIRYGEHEGNTFDVDLSKCVSFVERFVMAREREHKFEEGDTSIVYITHEEWLTMKEKIDKTPCEQLGFESSLLKAAMMPRVWQAFQQFMWGQTVGSMDGKIYYYSYDLGRFLEYYVRRSRALARD